MTEIIHEQIMSRILHDNKVASREHIRREKKTIEDDCPEQVSYCHFSKPKTEAAIYHEEAYC